MIILRGIRIRKIQLYSKVFHLNLRFKFHERFGVFIRFSKTKNQNLLKIFLNFFLKKNVFMKRSEGKFCAILSIKSLIFLILSGISYLYTSAKFANKNEKAIFFF